jgi:CheY-specific phosphatase CheX
MFIENESLSVRMGALVASACEELFSAYGVELTATGDRWELSDDPVLSGVMGFVGAQLRGTCLLAGAAETLAATCPEGGRARDWVGELTNQLVGRLKTKLLTRGVEVALTTPIILSGARLQPVPRGPLLPTVFSSKFGFVLVWVESEAAGDLRICSESPQPQRGEGDILMF